MEIRLACWAIAGAAATSAAAAIAASAARKNGENIDIL
jgi:hypothetical protein